MVWQFSQEQSTFPFNGTALYKVKSLEQIKINIA